MSASKYKITEQKKWCHCEERPAPVGRGLAKGGQRRSPSTFAQGFVLSVIEGRSNPGFSRHGRDPDNSSGNIASLAAFARNDTSLLSLIFFPLVSFLFLTAGCATISKSAPGQQKAVFYPAPPEEPRLQYLTSFSSSDDLEPQTSSFRKFIAGEEKRDKPIVKPYGVAVYNHKIYICDTVQNSIDILDLETSKFEYFTPKDELQLLSPINLAFDVNGDMYVADSRRGQVIIFDKEGNYLGAIGQKSEFKPTDVLVREGKIYICDLKDHAVKVFAVQGRQFLSRLPGKDAKDEARLFSPTNIAMDIEGNLYVSDTGAFRVQKYNPEGELVMTFGSHGDAAGQFARPKGIAVDKDGRVYVVDAAFENVQLFDKQGKLLLFFAGPGKDFTPLVLPAGIAVDASLKEYFYSFVDPGFEVEYLVLVTSQYGERKLSVFGFGHRK